MKKILVLCLVLAAALVSGTIYASKSGQLISKERQLQNQDVVTCTKQVDLFPTLFFF